jgi:hypothetical protein
VSGMRCPLTGILCSCDGKCEDLKKQETRQRLETKKLQAQNAQLRIQLQRCHGVFHTLMHGSPKELDELIEEAPKLAKQTRVDPEAGIEILAELTELRLELERLREERQEAPTRSDLPPVPRKTSTP